MDRPRHLWILGTSWFAPEVADLARETPDFELRGFVENWEPARVGSQLDGLPVVWVDDPAWRDAHSLAVCSLSTTKRSRFTDHVDALGVRYATLVHPAARISSTTRVGEGSIVSVGVIVASHSRLGRHTIVNRGALIGHHTEIGDHVTIGPGANIAGRCRIGSGTYVGMSAVILDGRTVGQGAVVGAGAVVTRDVPDHVQVMGVPARVVKERVEGR
jgi:sugar O-acyltransferase (sialic acid O-acetyltransferase NeuD family)